LCGRSPRSVAFDGHVGDATIALYHQIGETKKSVLRQHQRRAIAAIIERCADPSKVCGLVWHTQGSGQTFTLLTAARLILKKRILHDKKQSWTQPKLLRSGDDPILLLLVVSEYFKTAGEGLLRELGFAEHHARPDQFDPSLSVAR
jgi:hypothetical protein